MNLVTPEEFCQWAGISRRTYYRLVRRGLPTVLLGSVRRVVGEAAEAWIMTGGARPRRKKPLKVKQLARVQQVTPDIVDQTLELGKVTE